MPDGPGRLIGWLSFFRVIVPLAERRRPGKGRSALTLDLMGSFDGSVSGSRSSRCGWRPITSRPGQGVGGRDCPWSLNGVTNAGPFVVPTFSTGIPTYSCRSHGCSSTKWLALTWSLFGLRGRFSGTTLSPEEIFVCFDDFESAAREDAHWSVTEAELAQFAASLGLGEILWCAQRSFKGPPTVFVYTDQQAAELRTSPVRDQWADTYFTIVHRHDPFGYLTRDQIGIAVDSKENFDTNYGSNLYHYFHG